MAKTKKVRTLAAVLFDEGYVLRDKERGVTLTNLLRTDGKQITAGDVRAAQNAFDNWNRTSQGKRP